jgi:hypothetical protein
MIFIFEERKFGAKTFETEKKEKKRLSISERVKNIVQGVRQNVKKINKNHNPSFIVIVYSEQ